MSDTEVHVDDPPQSEQSVEDKDDVIRIPKPNTHLEVPNQQLISDSDSGIFDSGIDIEEPISFKWSVLWQYTGPGFLMSIAYLDPGNIEADLQAGSRTGYSLLWVLLWATLMGLILQTMAVKLGVCTGKHLAEHCAEEFPRAIRYILWLMAEVAIICVDCQEVIGTAVAINILSDGKVPIWAGVLLTALYTLTFLLMDRCVRKLEMMFGLLIAVMSFSFGAQYFIDLPPQGEVLKGTFLPLVPSTGVSTAVGLIGAVIMPHNLYLHSALVLSRGIDPRDRQKVSEAVYYNRIDSTLALLFSFVINLFVVCVFAHCRLQDSTDTTIGLRQAGARLTECAGGSKFFNYVFAIGLLASGQAATVTSTYAGQYVMQGYLDLKLSAWARALFSRLIAIGPGLLVGVIAEEGSDTLQAWLNVVQSIQLPFAIIPLLYFASSARTVGSRWVNSQVSYVIGWIIASIVVLANIYLVGDIVKKFASGAETSTILVVFIIGLILFTVAYVSLVGWLFLGALGYVKFSTKNESGVSAGDGVPIRIQSHTQDAEAVDELTEMLPESQQQA